MTEFKCSYAKFNCSFNTKKFIDKNSLVEFNEYIHSHILNSHRRKINRENYGLILSMFSWLVSTHPFKIPKLPQKKPKPKPNVHKKPPIDQLNYRPWASSCKSNTIT
jgi:predicted small metal-binding protein